MFRALFAATFLVTLLVNIIFLLAARERSNSLDDAQAETTATMLMASSGAFSSPHSSLVDSWPARVAGGAEQAQRNGPGDGGARAAATTRRLFLRSNSLADGDDAAGAPASRARLARRRAWRAAAAPAGPKAARRPLDAAASGRRLDAHSRLVGDDKNLRDLSADERADSLTMQKLAPPAESVESAQWLDKQMPKSLNVRVKSSKSHVLISVDNLVVHESGRAAPHEQQRQDEAQEEGAASARGIHVIVLNQFDGSVMARRTFDTYTPGQDDELCLFLGQLRPGRVVVFAVKDEASFGMAAGSQARKLLQSRQWASARIGELHWRDMWALVVRTASKRGEPAHNLAEQLTKSRAFAEWAPSCELQVSVELGSAQSAASELCAPGAEPHELASRRREFCARVEGYGRVCDCERPAPIGFDTAPGQRRGPSAQHWQLGQVPIVVIASNRPHYLYRMLRSLLAATGLNSSMVTVFVDGFYDEPVQVAKLFNLRAIQQRPKGLRSARISHHYKSALAFTFEQLHRSAKYALIFEEDLDVARDALIYFNQTVQVLEHDASLYCASAWNDQGYEHVVGARGVANRGSRVTRIETMPGLGWLLSRRLFVEELEPKWPSFEQAHDWDMWIRTNQIRRGRECLIPEVSRTFHFGSTGTNINSYFQNLYFAKHAFDLMSNVGGEQFASELQHLQLNNYERLIDRLLHAARPVTRRRQANQTQTISDEQLLCSLVSNQLSDSLAQTTTAIDNNAVNGHEPDTNFHDNDKKNSVIFIKMIDLEDYDNWLKLAHCWSIWDLDARGQHKAMWRLRSPSGHELFVVGSPASPYSKRHKPADLEPFDLTAPNIATPKITDS